MIQKYLIMMTTYEFQHHCREREREREQGGEGERDSFITRTIKGSSRDKIYQKLGLESSENQNWYRKVSYLFKIKHQSESKQLSGLILWQKTTIKRHRKYCCKNLFCSLKSIFFYQMSPFIKTV